MEMIATDSASRPRHRRARRSRRRGRSASRTRARSSVGSWPVLDVLRTLEQTVDSVERAAWELRGVADQANKVWGQVSRETAEAEQELAGSVNRLTRAGHTGWMLTQIAASYRLQQFSSAFTSERAASVNMARLHKKNAKRYTEVSEAQGGAFLKLGQLLSARPDLMPKVWIRQLSRLQDGAPPIPFAHVKATVERELGQPLDSLFAHFNPEPVAAASIGQVHKARTRDGQTVAVKVQRPGVDGLVKADMEMLEIFMEVVKPMLPPTDYKTIVEEIRGGIRSELDYAEERYSMGRVHAFLDGDPSMCAPEPREDLSSARVLTAEFLEGRKITDVLDELKLQARTGDERAAKRIDSILGRLLELYLKQVLQAGIFQADPHPGNILIGQDDKIILLDFGCSKELLPERRAQYLAVLSDFMVGRREAVGQRLLDLGFATRSGTPQTLLSFCDAMLNAFQETVQGGQPRWPEGDVLAQRVRGLLKAAEQDPVDRLPADFIMLARVFGTLGGLFNHYKPNIDFGQHVLPILGASLAMQETTTQESIHA